MTDVTFKYARRTVIKYAGVQLFDPGKMALKIER